MDHPSSLTEARSRNSSSALNQPPHAPALHPVPTDSSTLDSKSSSSPSSSSSAVAAAAAAAAVTPRQLPRSAQARRETRAEDADGCGLTLEQAVLLCFGIASIFFGTQLWIRSGGGGPGSFFGFGGHGGSAGSAQIPAIDARVEVPLQLVFDGGAIDVALPDGRQTICSVCSGSGAAPGHSTSCPHCGGQGHALRRVQLMPGFVQNMRHECPHCRGSGVLVTRSCPQCAGRKVVLDRAATVRVAVPAGCPDNHVVELLDAGHKIPGMSAAGSVRVRVVSAAHVQFERRGTDLHARIVITLREALLGFTRKLRNLDGKHVTIERAGVTAPDLVLEFRGEGLPTMRTSSSWLPFGGGGGPRGSLFVVFSIDMPDESFVDQHRERLRSLLR